MTQQREKKTSLVSQIGTLTRTAESRSSTQKKEITTNSNPLADLHTGLPKL
jgi:hypothetical protein